MNKRKAVYAASLDPITNGHLNVIERVAPLYDELIVVVAVDPRKTYLFSPEERMQMVQSAVAHLPNVSAETCVGRYVVSQAEQRGAQVIIRGLRNFKDLEDEQVLAEENRKICPSVETIWIPCVPSLMHVSSSMVKGHVGIDPGWEAQVARSVPAPVVTNLRRKLVLSKARKHWSKLMSALGNPAGSEQIFKKLADSYDEDHRAYHALSHIVSMLDEFVEIEKFLEHPEDAAMAIWYHDSVYDSKSDGNARIASNEARSAFRAEKDLRKLGFPESFISRVKALITATAHAGPVIGNDAPYLVDLDLAILGRPREEFDAYEAGIRQEYSQVPDDDFRSRRAAILESFLKRPSIYATQFFRERYERAARSNLARSIGQLQG